MISKVHRRIRDFEMLDELLSIVLVEKGLGGKGARGQDAGHLFAPSLGVAHLLYHSNLDASRLQAVRGKV